MTLPPLAVSGGTATRDQEAEDSAGEDARRRMLNRAACEEWIHLREQRVGLYGKQYLPFYYVGPRIRGGCWRYGSRG